MSLRAMLWALEDAPVVDPTQCLVLVALADGANDDGTGSWPSVKTLAERARVAESTVKRHLRELEKNGLIRKGDPSLLRNIPANRRPSIWDLDVTRRREEGDRTHKQMPGRARSQGAQVAPPAEEVPGGATGGSTGGATGGATLRPKQDLTQEQTQTETYTHAADATPDLTGIGGSPAITAAEVVAEFVDAITGSGRQPPAKSTIRKVAGRAARLLDEGNDASRLLAAAGTMGRQGWSNLDMAYDREGAAPATNGGLSENMLGHQALVASLRNERTQLQ